MCIPHMFAVWFLNYDYKPNERQREGEVQREGKERENVCFFSDVCCVVPYDYKPNNRGRKEREKRTSFLAS